MENKIDSMYIAALVVSPDIAPAALDKVTHYGLEFVQMVSGMVPNRSGIIAGNGGPQMTAVLQIYAKGPKKLCESFLREAKEFQEKGGPRFIAWITGEKPNKNSRLLSFNQGGPAEP